ncbi:hypothetical protein PG993_003726 [Apiospora rasikravindrae]|uniref:Uncharacterized protein n=1 Tax=Apiospora rasikravindrae TaxID=990691 RepID=A0ABR1U2J1_9PEZI
MERDDVSVTASSTVDGDTIYTPPTSVFSGGFEKASGRPIVRNPDGGISLGDPSEASTAPAHSHWLCVETNNHFGFQNPQSGQYLGHDGGDRTRATAWEMKEWEYIMWRPHPKGGFQLLSLFWSHTLKLYTVSEDGNGLVRRMHGTTLFDFKKL